MFITSRFLSSSIVVGLLIAPKLSSAFHQPGVAIGRRPPRSLLIRNHHANDDVPLDQPALQDFAVVPEVISQDGAEFLQLAVPEVASEAVLAPLGPALGDVKPKPAISWQTLQQRIRRRLNTHEDFMDVHKISAALWLLSLMYIATVGLWNGYSKIPQHLEIATWVALVTSVVQGITGYDMAVKYRAKDPIVQKGMINTSFQMISAATAAFYISPFAPEAFNDFQLGNGLFVATVVPSVIMGIDEIFKMKEVVEKRSLRKKEKNGGYDFGMVGDLSSYGFASLSGFVGASMALVFAADPCHDRAWILDAASRGAFSCPNFIPENYYAVTLFNLSIGVGIFAITLRDKKLISKTVEQTLVAIFTLPAAFLTLHASPF